MMQTMAARQQHAAMNTSSLVGLHCGGTTTTATASAGRPSFHSSASSSSAGSARSAHSLNSDAASTSSEPSTSGTPLAPNSIKSSSSSTRISSSSSSSASSRIRTVRLTRPNSHAAGRRKASLISTPQSTAFGFAIRGGREYSTGFFVSRVETGGEADQRGLRVGDQLIRVNGFAVDDAVHRELSQYVSGQDRLTLKVRGVGILPSKERATDPLTWIVVHKRTPSSAASSVTSHHNKAEEFTCQDVRITLDVEPRTKLGLGICKGPEWKPGIFVQFTKEMGVARDAGLRPGDQLLSCNGVDFSDVLFSEAVAVMKSSHRLELIVRNAAGVDLFPGESSGYNSSASSVTGDQSPCWGEQASKRLSIVREEDGSDKTGLNRSLHFDRQRDLDSRKELRRLHQVEPPIAPETFRLDNHRTNSDKTNTTIIKLSETGTIINNTMVPLIHRSQPNIAQPSDGTNHQHRRQSTEITVEDQNTGGNRRNNIRVNITNSSDTDPNRSRDTKNGRTADHHHNQGNINDNGADSKVADICFVSRKIETKTVTVEVHRGPNTSGDASTVIPPPPPPMSAMSTPFSSITTTSTTPTGRHSSLASSTMSVPSSSPCDAVSLSSAISDELKKRAERGRYEVNPAKKTDGGDQPSPNKIVLKKVRSAFGGASNDSDQHSALIDEFKVAHKKMFRNQASAEEESGSGGVSSADGANKERQRSCNYNGHNNGDSQDVNQLRKPTVQPDRQAPPPSKPDRNPSAVANGHDVVDFRKPSGQPDRKANHSNADRVSAIRKSKPTVCPETPSPDYDRNASPTNSVHLVATTVPATTTNAPSSRKGTMGRCAAHEIAKASGDAAELASIDSFKLINPASPEPKPPSLYFNRQKSGPATLMKPQRSVSVTIGEYAGQKEMPKPLEFLPKAWDNVPPTSRAAAHGDGPNGLVGELESTLSRSNLRAKNDSQSVTNVGQKSATRSISATVLASNHHPSQSSDPAGNPTFAGRVVRCKTQGNVGKITALLISQNLMGSRESSPSTRLPPVSSTTPATPTTPETDANHQRNGNADAPLLKHLPNGTNGGTKLNNGNGAAHHQNGNYGAKHNNPLDNNNRVTINVNQDLQANPSEATVKRKTDSAATPINGILKYGGNSASSTRNISFGHTTTVLTDNL